MCATMELELLAVFSVFFIKIDGHIFYYISFTRAYYVYTNILILVATKSLSSLPLTQADEQ